MTYARHANVSIPSTPEQDFEIHVLDGHNLLRPETVESIFVLYRLTGKPEYRDMGWNIFQAFEKYSKVASGGYMALVSPCGALVISLLGLCWEYTELTWS